ncbi:MAG: hypothetical protein D6743_07545 [Calditrichaeota bacterium]|nr:MAG: hypothetical protein D6743_07545 [Calditrichota bacterium]
MTVEFVCSHCDKDILAELSSDKKEIRCPHCEETFPVKLSRSMQAGGKVDRCVVCGKNRFYVQKDFNPRLGLTIFAIGVIFSYHTYGLTLLIATVIDFILYKVLKTVTICYNCRAIYRGFEEDPTHRGFDHELAMSLVEEAATKEDEAVAG